MFFGKKEPEEEVLLSVKNSRKVYIPIYLMNLILISAIVYLKLNNFPINFNAFLAAGIFLFGSIKFTELHRMSNVYKIGRTYLIHTRGIMNKNSKRLDLSAISDLDVYQSLWQRIIGYGDVNVRLFSMDSATSIKGINNPGFFARILQEQITKNDIPKKGGKL